MQIQQTILAYLLALLPQPPSKPIPGDSPLAVCDTSDAQLLTIRQVDLDPNPPQRGANLTIYGVGELAKEVTDGAYVDVTVNYGYIRLIQQTYDLCEQLPEIDMECPLQKGDYSIEKIVELPAQIPPGKYTVTARAYTVDDELISCLTGSMVFTPELI